MSTTKNAKGNIEFGTYAFPGDPTDALASSFNPPPGSIIIDSDGGMPRVKVSPLQDNSDYRTLLAAAAGQSGILLNANGQIVSPITPSVFRYANGIQRSVIAASAPRAWWNSFDLTLAETANVTTWADRIAGRALTTGASYPKYFSGGMNGRPWIYFDAATPSNPLVCTANIFSGSYAAMSVALVIRVPAYTAGYDTPIFCLGTSNPPNVSGAYGNNALALGWFATSESNPGLSWKVNQGGDYGGGSRVVKHRVRFTREMVMVVAFDGTKWSLWIDGICVSSDSSDVTPITINGGIAIGSLYTPTNYRDKVSMGVSEIAAWDRGLSAVEARAISRELMEEFTESQQRRVILMGDSTYEGTASPAGGTVLDVLQGSIGNAQLMNAARGGITMAIQNGTTSPYPEMYGSVRRGDIVILGPGSIDLVNLVSVAMIEANHAAIVAKLHVQGAIVICPTMIDELSAANQATSDTNRATYNAWINAGSSGADYVVDLTGVTQISANDAHSNSTYFLPDGAHLKAPGIALQAASILTVLRTALTQ